MNPALVSLLAGAASFLAFFLVSLVLLRLPTRKGPVSLLALLGLAVHGAGVGLALLTDLALTYWHGAALYWFLFNAYLFAFSAVYKSVSLRILWQLERSGPAGLPFDAISAGHVAPQFQDRIKILVEGGMARQEAGQFHISPAGKKWAARFARVQRLFGIQRGGLYGGNAPLPSKSNSCAA